VLSGSIAAPAMPSAGAWRQALLAPAVAIALIASWSLASWAAWWPPSMLPSPMAVYRGFVEELASGRLPRDIAASLYRVGMGFVAAVAVAVPLGLALGWSRRLRVATLPSINFARNLSPIAWMPFAVLWFGIGDLPAIFLIFLATVFPLTLATSAAVLNVPSLYLAIAREYGMGGCAILARVILPAVLPHLLIAVRLAVGMAWVVVVAAEMIAGRDGLGFAISDARNGLRADLLAVEMIVIGLIGVGVDGLLVQLNRLAAVRWVHG